jgi:hypothetical protein
LTKKFEDFLFTDKNSNIKILKFAEYRKGSSEYGSLVQDLMMLLRMKREENRLSDSIILTKKDMKNIDYIKLKKLLSDIGKMRKLGMTFDTEVLNNGIKFTNLGNKESRPWENNNSL